MKVEEIIAIWLLVRRLQRRKRKRKLWVHPLLSVRASNSPFDTLYEDLRRDEKRYFTFFHMSESSFDELVCHLNYISKSDTNMRKAIPVKERLAITLKYLASGCSLTDLHFRFRIGISTISQIIREVCDAIWYKLKTVCLPLPSESDWLKIAQDFEEHVHFPNCIGSIDGKIIRVAKTAYSGPSIFSVLLLAICDTNYNFTVADVTLFDKNSDGFIFDSTNFKKKLSEELLNIPQPRVLPQDSTGGLLPFVFAGNKFLGLSSHIMRPYMGRMLSRKKRVFNYRLSRASRCTDCTFAILTNKWNILHRPLNVSTECAESIVKTCVVLHNFIRAREGFQYENTFSYEGLEDIQLESTHARKKPSHIRDQFGEYFTGIGSLPEETEHLS